MSQDWYPWYPALFIADTLHLTAAQDGIYRRLLDWYMTSRRPLPDNDQALAAIARVGVEEWQENSPMIRAFFKNRSVRLHHSRCDKELDRQDKRMGQRSEIAKKGAEVRWSKYNNLNANSKPEAAAEHASSTQPALLPAGGQHARQLATRQEKTRQEKERGSETTAVPDNSVPTERAPGAPSNGSAESTPGIDIPLGLVRAPNGDWSIPLFRQALTWLAHASNRPPDKLRSFLGKALKAAGGDHRGVFDVIATAQRDAIADPLSWIPKAVTARYANASGPPANAPRSNGQPPRKLSVAERADYKRQWGLESAGRSELEAKVRAEGLIDAWTFGDG